MRIDEAILIMENERPHCGEKLTFTEGELCEAYTLALMALRDLQRAYDEGYKQGRYDEKVAAIDLIRSMESDATSHGISPRLTPSHVINGIESLLSAQPEPLTDKEQRIFLAAMGREEKVCKEVDAEMTREPYEDSLVRTCHEITRKVKGALWTI